MVLFKMRDSVPSARYSSVCNVLLQWSISLIPTYRVRVYGHYLIESTDSITICLLSCYKHKCAYNNAYNTLIEDI